MIIRVNCPKWGFYGLRNRRRDTETVGRGDKIHYDQYSVFEYDPEFRKTGLELAPFMMPLSKSIYHVEDFGLPRREFAGLPGMIADSLPDSFGNALSVNGKTGIITDDDLLLVAERFGIGTAKRALKEIEESLRFKV